MRVILFLLKCLVGLFATLGFLLVAAVAALAFLWAQFDGLDRITGEVPQRGVLKVGFGSGVIEVRPDNPLARISLRDTLVMRETLEAIEAAGRDPRIKGLLARVGRGALGLAQVQELRDAIARFRAEGKFAIAFAESFGEGGSGTFHYYLASAFDEVWMQPSGDLDFTGVMLESPFLREALDEIGVQPRIGQREEYKGAMSALTDRELSAPQRRNQQRLVDSWISQISRGVGEQRDLRPERVRALIDRAPYRAAEARDLGLVDTLGYWDQVSDAALDRAGAGAEFLELARYDRLREKPPPDGPVVALIYGLGPVLLDGGEYDPVFGRVVMGADTVAGAIADAVGDDEVKAIVFRIDSPGGSYVASDVIWREMRLAREAGKPVVVSMSNLAASGGYFVAAPAYKIVAQPGTVTGSIGVAGGKLVLSGLWDKLGVTWDGVQAGENAAIWSLNRDFSPAGWDGLQRALDYIYEDFTTKVAEGRGLARSEVLSVAKGQIWTGEDAKSLGLVDELGGLDRAVALAGEAAGLSPGAPLQLKVFPEERDAFDFLFEDALGGYLEGDGVKALVRGLARLAGTLAPVIEMVERLRADPRSQRLRAPDLRPQG